MPGDNCCINNCGVSRRKSKTNPDGKIGLFKVPAGVNAKTDQWRRDFLNIITKFRQQDEGFKRQLKNDSLHVCEKHFKPEEITIHHGKKMTKKFLTFGALPTLMLPRKSLDKLAEKGAKKKRPSRSIVRDATTDALPTVYYKDYKDLTCRVKKLCLREWDVKISDEKVQLQKFQVPYILPKFTVLIDETLSYSISFFNWLIPVNHPIYTEFKRTLKLITVSDLLRKIESQNICQGHDAICLSGKSIQHAIPVETTEEISPFSTRNYYRSEDCTVFIDGVKCHHCEDRGAAHTKQQKRLQAREAIPAKLKAPVSLTSAKRLKLTLQANRLKCKQLELKVEAMQSEISNHSVSVESDLSHDLLALISRHGHSMSPFMKLFWEQQQKNCTRVPNGQRYHPMIIRWCLSIASKSSAAYDELRGTFKGTGTLELPSRRQLRDYSNAIRPTTGFNPAVIDSLASIVKNYKPVERFVAILFDEMKVQSKLVWDKNTGQLIGYVDLGDPDTNYATLQAQDNIATHALVFMVKGICSKLQYALGYFATSAITSTQLFPLFWRAVAILEISCQLAVLATTADGASSNRRFFKMHEFMNQNNEKDVVHKVVNIYDESREIYFFSDAPHLLKTSRNCLFNSGSGTHSRYMWNNGDALLWSHIAHAYYQDQENGLHLLPKLTADHILLNSYSVMRVNLAAQVLSKTMTAVLREFSQNDVLGTAKFCEMINDFFDCFNVRNTKVGTFQRNSNLCPYRDPTDERLGWLETEFLGYLDAWKESIKNREGPFDQNARAKMFISRQTHEGMKISVLSLVGIVRFMLKSGAEYVLSNKLCQDPVEEYFGHQRGLGRRCDNPSIRDFGYNDNKLRIQSFILPVKGNTQGRTRSKDERKWHSISNDSIQKKIRGTKKILHV